MLEIFVVQVVTAILGTASIGVADWLYHGGRIRQRLHSLWVSCSIAAICLPLVWWTAGVFLGYGIFSQAMIGLIEAMIFLWVYRNLLRQPAAMYKFGLGLPPQRSPVAPVRTPPEFND
jgi:hypothetical protein